ncbi:c-terminal processing peptidase S41A [Proteobacteria bacterium CAG:495]|nr:c-terminal processing peptidase S41A [Proteobacteria bacterium CAG:495]
MSKKLSVLAVIALSLMLGMSNACAEKAAKSAEEADTYELLNLFGEVMERAKTSYVEEVDDKKLIESAINGMLVSLDPHSSYLDAQSYKYMNEQTKGKFGGLGIEVTMENGVVKIVSPIDDTPAAKAGLKPGDYITNIDGEQVIGMSLNDAVDKMRGKVGSKVKLTIRRVGEKPFEVTLKREEVKIQSVKNDIKSGDVAYIRITSFSGDTDKMVEKAIKQAKKELKGNIKGVVLDVRNNPGGLLDQAVNISDLFLDKGEIVSTRSRNEEDTVRYTAKEGDITDGLPIVVMINDGSASASEILAGALQDHKRAIILGEKSFGKGSVQTVVPLGKYGAMRLTTARYYTPSGRSIQATGIIPDVEVHPAKVEEYINNYGLSEAEYRNALKNEATGEDKKTENNTKDEDWRKDYQLSRAVDLVKALGIYTQGK